MMLAILHARGDSGAELVRSLRARGVPVDVIYEHPRGAGESRTSALCAVMDEIVPEFYRIVASVGGTIASVANPMLPLVDVGEYHGGLPIPVDRSGVTVYLLRLRRYERIR